MRNPKTTKSLCRTTAAVTFLFSCLLILFSQLLNGQDPLNGETKIEAPITSAENVLLGNISAGRSADKIAAALKNYNPFIKSIVTYNQEQAEMLAGYEKTRFQLQEVTGRYRRLQNLQNNTVDNLLRRSPLPKSCSAQTEGESSKSFAPGLETGLSSAADLVGSFVKLTSFFRTNVELRPETFTPDEKVIIAEVFRGLRRQYGNRIELYNQNSIPPIFSDSALLKQIQTALELDENSADKNSLIEERLKQIDCQDNKAAYATEKQGLTRLVAEYAKDNRQLQMIIAGLTGELPETEKSDKDKETKPKPTFLAAYLCVENIYRLIRENDGGYWLEVKPIKAGGTTRIKTNLVVDIFTGGDRVSHSGASLLEYNLYDKTGMSVLSGIVADYIPYIKSKKIPGLTDAPEERLGSLRQKKPKLQTAKSNSQAAVAKKKP